MSFTQTERVSERTPAVMTNATAGFTDDFPQTGPPNDPPPPQE